jgi:hypothetical protein
LRFFTRSSIVELLEGAGFDVEVVARRVPPGRSGGKAAMARLLGDLAAPQLLVRGRTRRR